MPSYKIHLVAGGVTYLGILQVLKYADPTIHTIFQGLIFCLLGSLFPDVDIKSNGQKLFYAILVGLLGYLVWHQYYCLFVIISFLGFIPIFVEHRGIFHHIWFLLSVILFATWYVKTCCNEYENIMLANCWFFFAGCLSHVLLDRLGSYLKKYF